MIDSQPRILFLSLSDDAGSERIVSEMSRRGARCSVMARTRQRGGASQRA